MNDYEQACENAAKINWNYYCRECAIKHGAYIPSEWCFTVQLKICPLCRQKGSIAHWMDWLGKPLD